MIRFLVMDVDGTLTDGKIYMGQQGELFKAFDVKDGYAIKEILPTLGITPVIITARDSQILQNRCRELGITELHQGIHDKFECLNALLALHNATLTEVAYIGDDDLDLQCILPIRQAGGFTACPVDASSRMVASVQWVSTHKANEGAVRDIVEHIRRSYPTPTAPQFPTAPKANDDQDLHQRVAQAINYIEQLDFNSLTLGRHDVAPDFYFNVMEYTPPSAAEIPYEAHSLYIDIQRIISGEEQLLIADASRLHPISDYDPAKDCTHYIGHHPVATLRFRPNSSIVLYPNDAHKAIGLDTHSTTTVKKIVGKLKISNE